MTVYVVQAQHRFDEAEGRLVPKFDLSPAEQHGRLEYLLSPSASPFKPEGAIADLHSKLQHWQDGDYLLLIGNPVLIGWAVAIAADYGDGEVTCLQWSGKDRRYIPVKATVFPE